MTSPMQEEGRPGTPHADGLSWPRWEVPEPQGEMGEMFEEEVEEAEPLLPSHYIRSLYEREWSVDIEEAQPQEEEEEEADNQVEAINQIVIEDVEFQQLVNDVAFQPELGTLDLMLDLDWPVEDNSG